MEALLTPLVGSRVKLGQRNGQDVVGVLINAKSDYATVFTDKGDIIHYPYTLIKSVTRNLKEAPRLSSVPNIAFPDTFKEVLASMVMQMVEVENSEGITRGVVIEVTPDNVGMVSEMKFVYYPIDQIYSISPIYKIKSRHDKKESEQKDRHKDKKPGRHSKRRPGRRPEPERQENGGREEEKESPSPPYYALVEEDDAYQLDEDAADERNEFEEPEDHPHHPDEHDEPEVNEEDLLDTDKGAPLEADEDDESEADDDEESEAEEENELEPDEGDDHEDAAHEEQIDAAESVSLDVPSAEVESLAPPQDDQPSNPDLEREQDASTLNEGDNLPENSTGDDPIYETFFRNSGASSTGARESASVQPTQPTVVLPQSMGNSSEDPRDIYEKTLNSELPDLFMWRNPVEKEQDADGNQEAANQNSSERDSERDTDQNSTNLSSGHEKGRRSTDGASERGKERRSTGENSRRKTNRRSLGRDSGRKTDRQSTGQGSGRRTDRRSTERNAAHRTDTRSTVRDSGRGTSGRSSGRGTGGSPKGRSR